MILRDTLKVDGNSGEKDGGLAATLDIFMYESFPGIPKKFFDELEYFSSNNVNEVVIETEGKKIVWYFVCLRCLKAHALNLADGMREKKSIVHLVTKTLHCDVGHDGYYLNKGEVGKVADTPSIEN